ncbi:hypothetical protein T484DRAFT_3365864 [Baffinella frigidus]|nr:hypothetical protein T484DRAFT_3365864 [Cryptophyta sp. CCMP2293]
MPKPNTTPGLALGMPKPGAAAPGLAMGTPKPSAAPTPGPGMAKQGNAPGGGNAALGMHKAPPPSPAPSDPKHKRRTVVKAPTDEDPPLGWTMKEVGHEGCEKKESYDGPDAPKEACKTRRSRTMGQTPRRKPARRNRRKP